MSSESIGEQPNEQTVRLSQLEQENKELKAENIRLLATLQCSTNNNQWLQQQIVLKEQYLESQLRFQTVFEASRLGNKILGDDLQILQVNQALVTLLGYDTKEELLGRKIIEYAHPDYQQDWRQLQQKLWTQKIPSFNLETCLMKKDGSLVWCSVTSILFMDQGNTLGYTIIEDINERKMLAEKLNKLYDSQQTIMHLAAHDLKGPILNIKGLTTLIQQDIGPLLVNEQSQLQTFTFLTMIIQLCDKAFDIINDLLLIGELETGTKNLDKEPVELNTFLESILANWVVFAQQKAIELEINSSTQPLFVQVNRDKFTRVIDNLISNAIKFSYSRGKVKVGLQEKAGKVSLQVCDQGMGIPLDQQATIFQKFTKANRKGTQGEATTGLGLYIVKQIVELHQGKIWVESQENQGTCFYIELP